jgi:hypothetical protein
VTWGVAAVAFGLLMTCAALSLPVRRRHVALAAAVAYALVAAGLATLANAPWVGILAPGALLLGGYWLSGLLFTSPQAWFEGWLIGLDSRLGAAQWTSALPSWLSQLLELSYASVHLVVAGGAIAAAVAGSSEVERFWNLVLTATLLSYALLPWLRSRPPRIVEGGDGDVARVSAARRLNLAVLDTASVQANTFPSGHVAGAVAAALGVMAFNHVAGWVLLGTAALIAAGAVAGRYHYAVDCVAGAALSVVVWSLM